MKRWIVVLALVVASCGKSKPAEQTKWLSLDPLPLEALVPDHASVGQHRESPDRDAPPGMLISARACVVVVMPGTRGPLDGQQTEVKAEHRDAKIVGLTGESFEYSYRGADGAARRSFRSERRIASAIYRCEPFTGRADITCERAVCASLRAVTAPVGP